MNPDEVTAQILEAWDELDDEPESEPEAVVALPSPDESEEPDGGTPETEPADEPDEQEGEDTGEGEGEEVGDETVKALPQFEDVEIQAFLAKYGDDVEKALKGAAELNRLMGRRDEEKLALSRQVEELQSQVSQSRALASGASWLSEEQQAWVEAAAESPTPGVYVQNAIQAGEFELARAVCREWAQASPYEAMRAGQVVDAVEYQQQAQAAQPEPVPPATTWQALSNTYPELRTYEEQMVQTLGRLGPEHPLVQEARSTDPAVAVRGIFGIYEIAKAATFALSETKNGLKSQRRQEADAAAENAAVTSASTSPSGGETPRRRTLMPGLSEEAFEAAFAEPQ